MRDIASKVSPASAIDPAVYAATPGSPNIVDLQGFDSAVLQLAIGIGGITFTGTNRIDFVLNESDDGVTFTPVAVSAINGRDAPATVTSGIVKSLITAHAAADITEIGYIGGKRYVQMVPTFGGTHGTGTPLQCTVVKGHPRNAPAP